MVSLPTPLRAAVGLVAVAVDEAKRLPDHALELPMLAVSTALQMSLRAQQQYTALAVRGDELLHHREVSDAPPEWAQFDDAPGGAETGALDDDTALAVTVAELVDEVETGTADPGLLAVADTIDDDVPPPGADSAGVAGERPLPGDPAADPSVFGAGLPQPTADGLGEAEDTGPEKTVRAPRNARPSRFDIIGDE